LEQYVATLKHEHQEYDQKLKDIQRRIQSITSGNRPRGNLSCVDEPNVTEIADKYKHLTEKGDRKFQATQSIGSLRETSKEKLLNLPECALRTRKIQEYEMDFENNNPNSSKAAGLGSGDPASE